MPIDTAKFWMPPGHIAIGVVCGAERTDHPQACGLAPAGTHALASVTAPAFDKGMTGKVISVDLGELGLMQPVL